MSDAAVTTAQMPPRKPVRYGPFARWLLSSMFDQVPFPEDAVSRPQADAQKSTLVYVLRSSSLLHLLYFNFIFSKLGLPLARAATGLGYRVFSPFARWYLGGPQVKAGGGSAGDGRGGESRSGG